MAFENPFKNDVKRCRFVFRRFAFNEKLNCLRLHNTRKGSQPNKNARICSHVSYNVQYAVAVESVYFHAKNNNVNIEFIIHQDINHVHFQFKIHYCIGDTTTEKCKIVQMLQHPLTS